MGRDTLQCVSTKGILNMKNKTNDTISLFDDRVEEPVEPEVLSVSEFNSFIKKTLVDLGVFLVKGEVTEFNITRNKGVHVTLSDGKANLRIGGYAPSIKGIELIEKDMDVVVMGSADLYVNYGSFSLKALSIEPVGEGSLAIAYKKLKEKLAEEGLFADEHKQPLPRFVTKIALLTGENSAAYFDFVKILKEHNAGIQILYYPVLVQGPRSVKSISKALRHAREQDIDLLILTRGGGSLEDLKSFNDESLAQLIFSSSRPVIAGVGHEKDESIADFVSDLRASTPSQAAYYIVEQNKRFVDSLVERGEMMNSLLKEQLSKSERLLGNSTSRIENSLASFIETKRSKISELSRILESYNIKNVLDRGFSILKKGKSKITSVDMVKENDKVKALLTDGSLDATIDKIIPKENGNKKRKN
jgi:exodeoxyribonuclease VII large subunit